MNLDRVINRLRNRTAAFTHDLTGFPLDGGHAGLGCDDCHTGTIGEMSSRCVQCHDDPHQAAHGADCGACHVPAEWPRLTVPLSAHRTPVHGGHGKLECRDCHRGGAHLEPVVACAACHARAHGGTEAACDTCHQVEGFRPARFDHGDCTCVLPEKHQGVERRGPETHARSCTSCLWADSGIASSAAAGCGPRKHDKKRTDRPRRRRAAGGRTGSSNHALLRLHEG